MATGIQILMVGQIIHLILKWIQKLRLAEAPCCS